jgi:error-prone DNA polymerase
MGFYHPSVLVEDARRRGVAVLPLDVNRSWGRCRLEVESGASVAVRLGFNYVNGIGDDLRSRLDRERLRGPYSSPEEFWRRTTLPRAVMESLVTVGAFDGFGQPRRELLWRLKPVEEGLAAGRQRHIGRDGPLQDELMPLPADPPPLPRMSPEELLATDYRVMGLTTGPHPVALLRRQLDRMGVTPLARAKAALNGTLLKVAGMVITRQAPPSAHGMRFFTLADESGQLDLILTRDVYRSNRALASHQPLLVAEGRLRSAEGVASLLVERLKPPPDRVEPMGDELVLPRSTSHDYC